MAALRQPTKRDRQRIKCRVNRGRACSRIEHSIVRVNKQIGRICRDDWKLSKPSGIRDVVCVSLEQHSTTTVDALAALFAATSTLRHY